MRRRTSEEGLELVEKYRASGMAQESFAKKARINVGRTVSGNLSKSVLVDTVKGRPIGSTAGRPNGSSVWTQNLGCRIDLN